MTDFSYRREETAEPTLGLIVLQSDETIEQDFRRMFDARTRVHVSRVTSAPDVTSDTLAQMADHLTGAARLFPQGARFDVVGYGCTSGTAEIGAARIARLVQDGVQVPQVTDPLTALVAACAHLEIRRLAFLSPYVETVSAKLRDALASRGVACPVFGSFNEPLEENVVRIDGASVHDAAVALVQDAEVDGVFLSCTNLQTIDVIERIETATGHPCLSSNQVMAWHMAQMAGAEVNLPGALGKRDELAQTTGTGRA